MGTLANLLKWKKSLKLFGEDGKPILDDKGNPTVVWIRRLGDFDMQEAHKSARIKSSDIRRILRNPESDEYKADVLPLIEASEQECRDVIKVARSANLQAEAYSVVVRPDIPTMEEVASDPDAPTLEEQEKLDAKKASVQKDFEDKIKEYVLTKVAEIDAKLESMSLEELRTMAQFEVSNIMPMASLIGRLNDEKVWRATYVDEKCKERGFSNLQEFVEADAVIREQLINAYMALESGVDQEQLKN
jgi:hypothetical protein